MKYIFIDRESDRVDKVGIVEDEKLVEFYYEDKTNIRGNIYRARVVDVLPGINAAFVDLGLEKNGYLQLRDALPLEYLYEKDRPKIQDILKSGDEILVQVVKEGIGNKGPKLTRHLELSGRYMVLTPYSNKVNISRKIRNKGEINRLTSLGEDIKRENMGMIFRTVSEKVEEEIIRAEYEYLFKLHKKIVDQLNFLPIPKLIYLDSDEKKRLIRDKFSTNEDYIIVNNQELYEEVLGILSDFFKLDLKDRLILDKDFSSKYDLNISRGISEALSKKLELKSGASIVIEETEALVAIDVNTEGYLGRNMRKTIFDVNLESSKEIARQIRLRNLSGMILIDFIRMNDRKQEDRIRKSLEYELGRDSIKSDVHGFSRMGLMEITREKTRNSLSQTLLEDCSHCKGTGKLKK